MSKCMWVLFNRNGQYFYKTDCGNIIDRNSVNLLGKEYCGICIRTIGVKDE